MTGTPIQNKLTDFASILKFLQVYPYCNQKTFDEEISCPWHLADRDGFLRLKSLVRAITISRTKTVIDLPARVDEVHHLEFSPEERRAYDSAKKETVMLFEEAISSGRQGGKTFNALTRINILRLFCNLGIWVRTRNTSETSLAFRDCGNSADQSADSDVFFAGILDGSTTCVQCGQALLKDLFEGMSIPDFDHSPHMNHKPNICEECRSQPTTGESETNTLFQREHPNISTPSSGPSTPSDQTQALPPFESIPTKIKALVADLSKNCTTEKW
jgi:hypothetical protein